MRLSYVELEGFRGFKDKARLDFGPGFTVITGRNGTGKSTICDALEFALRGKLDKYHEATEKRERGDDYVWWRGEGSAQAHYVRVGLVNEDGQELSVERSLGGVDDSAIDALLRAELCSTDLAPPDPMDQLVRTSIIRDESITLDSIDLAERERYFFVHAAIGSNVLTNIERRARAVIEILQSRQQIVKARYEEVRKQVTNLHASIADAQTKMLDASDRRDAVTTLTRLAGGDPTDVTSLIANAKRRVATQRALLESLSVLRQRVQRVLGDSSENELRQVQEETENKRRERDELATSVSKAPQEVDDTGEELVDPSSPSALLSSLRALHEHGRRIGLRDGHCPLCGLEVSAAAYARSLRGIQDEVTRLVELVASDDKIAREARADREGQLSKLRELESAVALLERRLAEMQDERRALRSEFERQGLKLTNVPTGLEAIDAAVAAALEQIESMDKSVGVLEGAAGVDDVRRIEGQLQQAEAMSARTAGELSHLDEKLARARSLFHQLQRAVGEVVEERLASLEPLLNDLYARLRPHADWQEIYYHMRGDVRHFLSLRIGDNLNPRFMFSSGQRRAAGIAFLLAVFLSRPWSKLRTLILDDPVQHVDDYRALHLVETVSAIRASGYQVICTVEDPALAELLCRRMTGVDAQAGRLVEMMYTPGAGSSILQSRPIAAMERAILRLA